MATLPKGRKLTFGDFDRSLGARDERDLSQLVFVDAFGLVGTACALLATAHAGVPVHVRLPHAAQRRAHLSGMGFTRFLSETGLSDVPDPTGPIERRPDVVVPLTRIDDISSAERLSHLLWSQVRSHTDPLVLEALTEGLWELVANALEHSGSEAVLMGQVYRGGEPPDHDDRVQIAIGDAGRGIRSSFVESGTHRPESDAQAIHLALEYLVSSVSDPGRGQGLTTTVEQVTALQGRVVIRSGEARVTRSGSRAATSLVLPITGTIVGISLPLYPG